MKNLYHQLFAVLVFSLTLLSSCENGEEQMTVNINLFAGKWDAYRTAFPDGRTAEGLQYAVLLNYEHGFEIFKTGEYKSRYANGTTFEEGLHTTSETGTWKIESDTLTFSHTFQGLTDQLHFLIIKADNSDLVIRLIGNGDVFSEAFDKTIYLKKAID